MIEAALHVFQETTLVRCIETIVEIKVLRFLETVNCKAVKGKQPLVYEPVERAVRRFVALGAINEAIHMKINNLAESEDFVQHFTLNFIKNPSFTLPITNLVKQHAQASFADETHFMTKPRLAPIMISKQLHVTPDWNVLRLSAFIVRKTEREVEEGEIYFAVLILEVFLVDVP